MRGIFYQGENRHGYYFQEIRSGKDNRKSEEVHDEDEVRCEKVHG
jgi:hypothetical protein